MAAFVVATLSAGIAPPPLATFCCASEKRSIRRFPLLRQPIARVHLGGRVAL